MTTIKDLRGFCYPLTPGGVSSLVGDLPWHYIAYRTDPAAIAPYLPEPLAPGTEPDLAYVAFSRWWSLWDNQPEMAFTNPERTQYRECAIWVGCSFQGTAGQVCLQIWVSNDFTLARGWIMGFAKRLGQTYLTEYHPLNPRMPLLGPGAKRKGYVCAHGKRLIEGTLEIEKKITCEELPRPIGLPIFHIRHFPSIVRGAPSSVLELVKLGADNVRYGDNLWAGRGTLRFFPPRSKSTCRSPLSKSSAPIISARGIASLAGSCCIAGSSLGHEFNVLRRKPPWRSFSPNSTGWCLSLHRTECLC